jgi:transcriptional regulator with XRE-family HTH domain
LLGYGERITKEREKRNLTQEQLSKKLGISRAALSHYEKNRREPDYETLERISSFFEVSTDYLLGIDQVKEDGPGYMVRTNPELADEILREFDRLPKEDQQYIADLIKRMKKT